METAAQAFRLLTTGPAPLALDGAAAGCGLPARPIPLRELRALLLHPDTGRRTRDAAWAQIIDNAHSGTPAWVIGAVGMALPALWAMANDLAEGYGGDPADLHSALLTGFVAVLHHVDTDRPGIVTRLKWGAYRAGLLARYHREGAPALPPLIAESVPPPAPWAHPDLLLADAVAKGVLSPVQAELIGRSRLEDRTLKEAADELGVNTAAAYKTRKRGEARLAAGIASGKVEHRVSNLDPQTGLYQMRAPNTPPRQTPAQSTARSTIRARARGRAGEPDGVRGQTTTGTDGTPEPETSRSGPAHHPQPHTHGDADPDPHPGPGSRTRPAETRRRPRTRRRRGPHGRTPRPRRDRGEDRS